MTNDPNTVLIGLLQDKRCAALAKLRKYSGDLEEIAEHVGDGPWAVLEAMLTDIKPVKATQCVIFSNAGIILNKCTQPPKVNMTDKGFMYFDKAAAATWQQANRQQFVVLHLLFQFNRFRYVEVDASQLSSTRRLLDDHR